MNKENSSGWFAAGFMAILMVAIIVGMILQQKNHHEQIAFWAAENGCQVESIERALFDKGPFWYADENAQVYKVVLVDRDSNRRTSYFKLYFWSMDQAWE